jgi:hypothetical protein
MKILIAHEFVMGWRMMFGKIISTVGFPTGPVEVKLLLSNAIFKPVVTHVKGFSVEFHGYAPGVTVSMRQQLRQMKLKREGDYCCCKTI